jgi:AraC-like DNA-binding protein
MQIAERDWSRLQTRGRAVPRDVKVAVDYMRQHIGRKIGIADIVTVTGTPERTLHKHFARFFGLAPLAFLRRLRLAAARDALLTASGDSVTDVAARLRFTHFGRFSSDYRRCFGELPSETRRRANSADRDHASPTHGVSAPQLSGSIPTLAIMPFQTQGDRHSNWLADSIVELLAAELARARPAPSGCHVRPLIA